MNAMNEDALSELAVLDRPESPDELAALLLRRDMATPPPAASAPTFKRSRGRPRLMTSEQVCAEIRRWLEAPGGLTVIHRRNPALYARARRQFGNWAAAVRAARPQQP